ncbi:bridging integrator 3-like [Mercenaria mercenaria]|uniref:bridging integrator 3-like n=1 Tax=Mercenaria mercenaria TaxID=6596 RepID=UPI001E1DD41B|nr:bridging integrator 3-like [Mercenaria mercenaria]
MSWNPFSRHGGAKKSVVSRQAERELEREVKKLDELDEASRKLYKDGRRYVEANNGLGKAENKIIQDLLASGICQTDEQFQKNIEAWEKALEELSRYRQELNNNIQKTMVEPMKKFSGVFPSVQSAIKKREQSLQDYTRTQAKFNKYQDRDRTGQNIVKLDTNKKALDAAREEFEQQNVALRQELPRLIDGRIEYFKPSFDALIRSQLNHSTEAFKTYAEVSSELFHDSKLTENERKERINQTLNDMKALSITVDD